jgi:glyoxylase I family protein
MSEAGRPSAPPFTLRGLDHVVLRAIDPQGLERFYRDVLGCELDRRQEQFRLTQLRAGHSLIDIVPASDAPASGLPAGGHNIEHICLRIDPFDRSAILAHLKAHGVCTGEVASRYGADGYGPSIYLLDPEGNRVELKGPPTPPA